MPDAVVDDGWSLFLDQAGESRPEVSQELRRSPPSRHIGVRELIGPITKPPDSLDQACPHIVPNIHRAMGGRRQAPALLRRAL
jgi:hypothetical protein